jgi:DNA repair protein RadC
MKVREIILKYRTSEEMTIEERKMDCPKAVFEFCKDKIGDEAQEVFLVLILDNKNRILAYKEVSRGSISETLVHPRETFIPAIMVGGSSIVIVHNHPSGEVTPSKEDVALTKRIKESGEILGIELLDHVIIGIDKYTSFKESGYL